MRDSTIPLPSAPTNTLQPPALTDLVKKPAEKEGEEGGLSGGWIGELLQLILVKEVAGADPRQRAPES